MPTETKEDLTGLYLFIAKTGAIFGVMYIVYTSYLLDSEWFTAYLEMCASFSLQLLNAVFGEKAIMVYTETRLLTQITAHDGAYIVVSQGCDGFMTFAIILATIVAWPGPWLKKSVSIVLGLLFMFCLNILRIILMFKVDVYWSVWFDLMSQWVLPLAMILIALLYFYFWSRAIGTHPLDKR